MSDPVLTIERGRWYPCPPPGLPGETDEQYTDRLTGADKTNRRPYDHPRGRQCSIGYHSECSDRDGTTCGCPHHKDPGPPAGTTLASSQAIGELERLYDLPLPTSARILYEASTMIRNGRAGNLTELAEALSLVYLSPITIGFAWDVAAILAGHDLRDEFVMEGPAWNYQDHSKGH